MCFSAQYEPHHYINLATLAADSPVTAADCDVADVISNALQWRQATLDSGFPKRRVIMNKDQVKGTAKDIAGKVQEGVGKVTGDREQEAKGLGKQVEGKTQKKFGDAKETVKDAIDKV
jgi:uncharacterized protein YjbJ (UPF0337 family)